MVPPLPLSLTSSAAATAFTIDHTTLSALSPEEDAHRRSVAEALATGRRGPGGSGESSEEARARDARCRVAALRKTPRLKAVTRARAGRGVKSARR